MIDRFYGKPPEQVEIWLEIERLADEGREDERGAAADRLAAMMMASLGTGYGATVTGRKWPR